jgi:hypothetical protein
VACTTKAIEASATINTTAPLNQQAIIKGLQELSAEERAHLLNELITSDHQSSLSF